MRVLKKVNVFKTMVLSVVLITGIFSCVRVNATGPIPVSGRVLQANKELGDNSDWMEIARFNDFSLILRLNCLPQEIPYDNSGIYCGYLRSNVKKLLDEWFYRLNDGDLKRSAVGNNAQANLGWFQDSDQVYTYNTPGEAKGNGISLPMPEKPSSTFILSYQEARRFAFSQSDSKRTEPATLANFRFLSDFRKEEKTYFFGLISGGMQTLRMEPGWLRSPGNDKFTVSCCGSSAIKSLFFHGSKELLGVRPALWIRTSAFNTTPHPSSSHTQVLDLVVDDEKIKTKINDLLLCEDRNMEFLERMKEPYVKPKYHILFTKKPSEDFLSALINTYYRKKIISKNSIVKLNDPAVGKLNLSIFEHFVKSTFDKAEGGILCVNAKLIFDVTDKDIRLRFEKFMNILAAGKCLVIVVNCPPELKDFIDGDGWHCNRFETLDFGETTTKMIEHPPAIVRPTIAECLSPLNSLVGMDNFKKLVKSLLHDFRVYEIDSKMGIVRDKPGLHMVLMGSPGTGKTTVAQTLGDILFKAGIIQKNIVVKAERADLVGKYQGHTEAFVRDKIKEAEGGILFIDEAYSLTAGGSKDFGQRAIEGLLTPLTTNQCVIIAAGYTNEMQTFLRSNSGLPGRFDHEIVLKDYTSEELLQIFENLCAKSNLILDGEAKKALFELFETVPKGPTFSNARYARKIYDTVMRIRSMSLSIDVNVDSLTETEIQERKTIKPEYIASAKEELARLV